MTPTMTPPPPAVLLLGPTELLGERYPAWKLPPHLFVSAVPADPADPDGPADVTIRQEEDARGTYTVRTAENAASLLARLARLARLGA